MTEGAAGPAVVRTFLIADVRGYTRFTQEQGDEAAAVLAADFAALVRECVGEFDGTLIELRGDEALVAFASARQALRAAVEIQRRSRESTGDRAALPLGFGIGLDSGEAVPTEGGYRGGALNLAARLCSIAQPGEILASEGVVHLARRVPGLHFGQPRPVRLKGMADRVRAIPVLPDVPLPQLPAPKQARRRRLALGLAAAGAVALAAAVTLGLLFIRANDPSTALAANAAGLVDAMSGHVVAQIPVSGRPSDVAVGFGSIWVTDAVGNTVLRIDADKHLVVDRIEVGRDPEAVVAGGGSMWVANGQDGTVSEVNPETGTVVATRRVGNGPTGLAYVSGAVWVVNELDATLSRISAQSGDVEATVALGHNPSGISAGLGAVWVTSEETGLLLRIDPSTNAVSQTIAVGNGPTGVTVGKGAVWVANPPDRTISRVDPASGAVTKIVMDAGPSSLEFTANGLWSTTARGGRLVLVDPEEGRVRRAVDLVSSPAALANAGDRMWVVALASRGAHRGGTLRVLSQGGDAFDSIDPGVSFRAAAWQALSLVYDGLVTFRRVPGPLSATIVPNLATSLPTPEASGTTYTFHLRPGIRYSDGRHVKTSDFRYGIERQFRAGSGFAGVGLDLVGADRCSRRHCDLSRGVVTDERTRTVTYRLTRPDREFLFKLALPFGAAVPVGSPAPDVGTRPLPATGPYKIERYRPERTLVLVRNPRFHQWSADAQPTGYVDRLEWKFGGDAERATTMVERGQADVMTEAPPEERLSRIARLFPGRAHRYGRFTTFYLFLNTRLSPFDDVRVRKAVNFAADRAAIVEQWGGAELARPTCQLLPPGFPSYEPYCPYTTRAGTSAIWTAPDVKRARRLLRSTKAGGVPVTVAVNGDDPRKLATARYFVRVFRALGLRARLRVYPDIQTFYEAAGKPASRVQAGVQGWESAFFQPSDFFLNLLTCDAYQPAAPVNVNAAGFCNREIDRTADRAHALQANDPGAAGELWREVDRRVVDLAPLVPFVNTAGVDLVSSRTGNYQRSVTLGVLLDQLWVR